MLLFNVLHPLFPPAGGERGPDNYREGVSSCEYKRGISITIGRGVSSWKVVKWLMDEFDSEVIPDTNIAFRFPEIDFAVVLSMHDSNSDRTNN